MALGINVFKESDFTASSFTDVSPSNSLQPSENIDEMTKLPTNKSSEKRLKCYISVSNLSLLVKKTKKEDHEQHRQLILLASHIELL